MAHLWRRDADCWRSFPAADDPMILRSGGATGGVWLLLASPDAGLAVNGEPVRLGLAVLQDRDEILCADGERVYFACDDVPVPAPLASADPGLRCARCQRVVEAGDIVVRCPRAECGLVHHENETLQCWTYDTCAGCARSTALDAERWTPDAL